MPRFVSIQIEQCFFAGRVYFIYYLGNSIAQEIDHFLGYSFEFDCGIKERSTKLFAYCRTPSADEVAVPLDLKKI